MLKEYGIGQGLASGKFTGVVVQSLVAGIEEDFLVVSATGIFHVENEFDAEVYCRLTVHDVPEIVGGDVYIRENFQIRQPTDNGTGTAFRGSNNLINWGMLPFLIEKGELPFKNLDYIFVPGIRKSVEDKDEVIKAYAVKDGALKEFDLKLGELTDEERQIILKGCLINYNRV